MKLSIIVPSIDGSIPKGLPFGDGRVEIIVVRGVCPVGKARNEGLRQASGDYIAWVDADDEVEDNWLDEIWAKIEADTPDVITMDVAFVGWKNREDGVWGVPRGKVTIGRLRRDVYRDISRTSSLWLYVTKRSLWKGLSFDENICVAEDYLLLPKVLARANSCAYVDKKIYRYNFNPQSLMNARRFGQDAEAIESWARRLKETERKYRGECLWGMCVSCYWLCDEKALDCSGADIPGAGECAAKCRRAIRMNLFALLREAVIGCDLSFRERIAWSFRFICAATGWWAVQRWRRRARMRNEKLSD